MSDTPKRIYEFGPFRVDVLRRILLREGAQVRLPAKAFEILLVLLEERGRLVEKDELIRRVWSDSIVEESNLTVNMSALRKSLAESPGEHRYVVTVPGRGYQFVADVRRPDKEADATTTALRGETDRADVEIQASSKGNNRSRQGIVVLIGALLSTTIVIGYFLMSRRPALVDKSHIRSLAVLPFANNSNDLNLEYLSDGISESLINSLSQLPDLKVIARSSSSKYKGKEDDLNEIANALGVEAVLIGRLSAQGDQLIIKVELVDMRNNTHLWGKQYISNVTDIPMVQSDLSSEIAEELRFRLSENDQGKLAKGRSVNPLAYEMLLKGRFYWNKGSDQERKKAVELFNQAIAIEPTYALAYADLANAYAILGNDGIISQREALDKAANMALKALELDDGIAEAHQALAYNKQLAWDWAIAEREYKRAIELNPNYAEARASYSLFLGLMSRHDEATAEAKRAKELDPVSVRINIWLFNTLFIARKYDEAIAVLKQMQELDPNHPLVRMYFASAYTMLGRYAEAIALYKEATRAEDYGTGPRLYLGIAYSRAGELAEARAILHELRTTKEHVSPVNLAVLLAGLGQNDQAFESLEKAYIHHDLELQTLGADPYLDSLRSDPRYGDLMRRVGLIR